MATETIEQTATEQTDVSENGNGHATDVEAVAESIREQIDESKPVTKSLLLAVLKKDCGTQMRVGGTKGLDAKHLERMIEVYADARNKELKKDGTAPSLPPPPVVYFDKTQGKDGEYYLCEGFHRTAAAEAAGYDRLACEVRIGNRHDALLAAAGANASHGLPRSNKDKRWAVEVLLRDPEVFQLANVEIAKLAAVSSMFVGTVAREIFGEEEHGPRRLNVNIQRNALGKMALSLSPEQQAAKKKAAADAAAATRAANKAAKEAEEVEEEAAAAAAAAEDTNTQSTDAPSTPSTPSATATGSTAPEGLAAKIHEPAGYPTVQRDLAIKPKLADLQFLWTAATAANKDVRTFLEETVVPNWVANRKRIEADKAGK